MKSSYWKKSNYLNKIPSITAKFQLQIWSRYWRFYEKKLTLLELKRIPVATMYKKRPTKRRSLPSNILTESHYKNELEDKENWISTEKHKIKRKIAKDNENKNSKKNEENGLKHNNYLCFVRRHDYATSKEDWYQCHTCSYWARDNLESEMSFTSPAKNVKCNFPFYRTYCLILGY